MVFVIKLCDIVIRVKTLNSGFFLNFSEYVYSLMPHEEPDIDIEIQPSDIAAEESYSDLDNNPTGFIEPEHRMQYIESLAVYRKITEKMLLYRVLLMHGVVIETNGQGYMIIGTSGVGKTTRANIWLKEYPNSIIVNGDKPLIKLTETSIIAYGTPWCGKEGHNNNKSVPVNAILLLERADDKNDMISELSLLDAFPALYQQTYHPTNSDEISITLKLLREFEGKVKFYRFRSSRTPESIRMAFETANMRSINGNKSIN